MLRCASRSKWISPFLYSDDQWKKLTVSIGSFYPLWLLSVKFKKTVFEQLHKIHQPLLLPRSAIQRTGNFQIVPTAALCLSRCKWPKLPVFSLCERKSWSFRPRDPRTDGPIRELTNSSKTSGHERKTDDDEGCRNKKKKCFFLVTCIVHTYILVGWWFVLSNGGLRKNRNETKLISQNSIFVLYHMTTRRCCHNIVQSSFLPAFASWSRFSISLMMVWKISCTLCGKERNIRAQFKRMKG